MFQKLAFDFSILEIRHAWRIGIVSVFAYLLSIFVFHLESPQWVMLTAIVCSQTNLGSTMRKSKQRLVGTVLGCAFGFLAQHFLSGHVFLLVGLFLLSFLISLQFIIKSYTLYSAFFTFAFVLMMFFLPSSGPAITQNVAFLRVEDVIIGVLIGTAGSFLLWPDFASKIFGSDIGAVVTDLRDLFQAVTKWINNQDTLDAVMAQKAKSFNSNQIARDRIIDINYEFGFVHYPIRKYEKFIISQERIHYVLLLIVQSVRYAREMEQDETTINLFGQQIQSILIQYLEIVRHIPHVSNNIKHIPETLKEIANGSNGTLEENSMNPKFQMHLQRLRFELDEMNKTVNEINKYE